MKRELILGILALAAGSTAWGATATAPTAGNNEYCQTIWQVTTGHCDFNYGNATPTNPTGEYYTCSDTAGTIPPTKSATCTVSYGIPPQPILNSKGTADRWCATQLPRKMSEQDAKAYLNKIKCSYSASQEFGPAPDGTYGCVNAATAKDPLWKGQKCAPK